VNSDIKSKLGHIIKYNRKIRKLTQKKLSDNINYNQSVICKIEKGNDRIHQTIYVTALQYFKLNYLLNQNIDSLIDELIEEVYDVFLYLRINETKQLMSRIDVLKNKNQNAIQMYNLLILELVLNLLDHEFDRCREMLKTLVYFYPICDKRCQVCFIYVNNYFKTLYHIGENVNINDLNLKYDFNQTDGFIDYLMGWCYYYEFNYSKALSYLHEAIIKFTHKNNICRFIRSELLINEILLIDKHYHDVFDRTKKIIDKYPILTCIEDYSRIYFQLGYCAYYLKEYKQAKTYFLKVIEIGNENELHFVQYMYLKCLDKLSEEINYDLINQLEVNKHNVLTILYFRKLKEEDFYQLIEDYIIPEMNHQLFKTEIQYYLFLLLDYYWVIKKYRQYKNLNEIIYQLLHIL